MEIGEIIAPPSMEHSTEQQECPFCPPPKDNDKFTTYPGSAKSEANLKDIMADPACLSSKQSSARDKLGQANQQQPASAKRPPQPPLAHDTYGVYTYEAHHLIPGREKIASGGSETVMDGHPIEQWIKKGAKIDRDSGYSINNSDNGVWLPSVPLAHKKQPGPRPSRPWASPAKTTPTSLQDDEKTAIANFAMMSGAGQFHYGPHKVSEEDGAHYTYPKEVAKRLTALHDVVTAWSQACICDHKKRPPKPPFKPTWKINEKLDLVSMWIEIDIRLMPPRTWTYFISSLARDLGRQLKSGQSL